MPRAGRVGERQRQCVHREVPATEVLFEGAGLYRGQGSVVRIGLAAHGREVDGNLASLQRDGAEAVVRADPEVGRRQRPGQIRGARAVPLRDDQIHVRDLAAEQ